MKNKAFKEYYNIVSVMIHLDCVKMNKVDKKGWNIYHYKNIKEKILCSKFAWQHPTVNFDVDLTRNFSLYIQPSRNEDHNIILNQEISFAWLDTF